MKRVTDIVGPNRLYQFGIRSGLKEEFEFAKRNHYIEPFTIITLKDILKDIKDYPLYISLDLDVLDPSIMSGTGTPEPGGVSFIELLQGLLQLKGCTIVGADVVELAPHYDASGVSTAVAIKLIREMLLLL
jgi:agmatinase